MRYPGGKNQEGVAQWIINQMPPHALYVEAFAGSGAILRTKKLAASSIAIDCDASASADLASYFSSIGSVQVLNVDAIAYLQKMRCPQTTLIYCDPPYLMETRRGKKSIYRHEFSRREQHVKLLEVLQGLNCMVMISGYRSSLYDAVLQGWRRVDKTVTLRGGQKACESLWMNYAEPVALHDYRFLGESFRERERLKRIQNNLKNRLMQMPILERRALLEAIAEIDGASCTVHVHIAENSGASGG